MTPDIDLSIRQFAEAWRVMCAPCEGSVVTSDDGIDYRFSGLPIPFFNVALLTEDRISASALASLGQRACAWASERSVPWLFVLTHEALETGVDPAAVLERSDLVPLMLLTGMHAREVGPASNLPGGLELVVPDEDDGCAALLDVNSAAYAMELDAGKAVLGRRSFWQGHVPVLGRVEGRPVSCAAVLMVDGVRYVALVATNPGDQRRGYADAAMRRALQVAADTHGELPTVLHATEAGRPVYQRMGYATISTHTVFIEKRFLAGH
jgi:hypothetical protein